MVFFGGDAIFREESASFGSLAGPLAEFTVRWSGLCCEKQALRSQFAVLATVDCTKWIALALSVDAEAARWVGVRRR